MTDKYHPVTKEHCNHECVCHVYRAFLLARGLFMKPLPCANMDDMCIHDTRSRPDPLALLEKWVRYESERGFKNYNHSQVVIAVCGMIDSIRENPEAVRQQGIKEGWWVE